jgi:hypothetical protein
MRRVDEPVSATPPAAVCVVAANLFGTSGIEEADSSEPDLSFAFGFGFAAVVGSDVLNPAELPASAASLTPALPDVVEEINPPELSEFICAGATPEAPTSPVSADPDPASEPLPDSAEPVVADPVVPEVVDGAPEVSEVAVPDDVSVVPLSGPAHATPGAVATATPTPKATASPPTRPI